MKINDDQNEMLRSDGYSLASPTYSRQNFPQTMGTWADECLHLLINLQAGPSWWDKHAVIGQL